MFRKVIAPGLIPILGLWISSCTENPETTFLVFIDYSASAATLEPSNQNRFLDQLRMIWDHMRPGEPLIIYPIHLLTETSSPIVKIRKPVPNGDLNDGNQSRELAIRFLENMENKLFKNIQIPPDLRSGTNIYPVLMKIARFTEHSPVNVLIVSDMIHEFIDEQLDVVFAVRNAPDPIEYADKKWRELNLSQRLTGVSVTLAIPGTYQGDIHDETLRYFVIVFWEQLFSLCGAQTFIEDL